MANITLDIASYNFGIQEYTPFNAKTQEIFRGCPEMKDGYYTGRVAGTPNLRDDLRDAIMAGAVERVRPKMMTVTAIIAGLLPILWSHGTGTELMQRIAVPMIGGMVSSTVLTLIVIPAVYGLVKGWGIERARQQIQVPIGRPAE